MGLQTLAFGWGYRSTFVLSCGEVRHKDSPELRRRWSRLSGLRMVAHRCPGDRLRSVQLTSPITRGRPPWLGPTRR
jgi:hypothetical protein